ncbi:MAG: insulinase family protein [Candidatus Berkelbacteria bacterium]|nr:insulinase family protein [Candidatus Berkelbacteria bacterium]MCR4308216.1 insulinase family protein [Candidatus Berkelbacteria bacterium]
MNKLTPQFETLPNGLTLVLINLPGFHSLTNFLVIRSGSRYENEKNNGVAHFLEHMVFKGTVKYPDKLDIAQSIEGVGGYFNAWTSNDHTAYWNTVPLAAWQRGIEVPFELAFNALLREEDLEQERGVVIEEIRRMQDDPSSYVDELLGPILFPGHQLGQSVIGSEENIRNMTIKQFRDYRETYYHPGQALFICIGNIGNRDIKAEVVKLTAQLKPKAVTKPQFFTGVSKKDLKLINKKTDQTHFMLALSDPEWASGQKVAYVGVVMNAILGRGMSSRLFLNIREKKGLAYSIHSSFQDFEETGAIVIDGGVNTEKIEQTLEAIDEELAALRTNLVGKQELDKAKSLIIGSFEMSADRPIDLARWYGTGRLLGDSTTIDEAVKAVRAVTVEQIQALAKRTLVKERQVLAVIGPYESDKIFRKFLKV